MQEIAAHSHLYLPPRFQPVTGALQIVHDMGEYQDRYKDFAEFLCSKGIAVITSDLKGHGRNVNREAELGYFGDHAISNLIGGIHELTRIIKDKCPNVPYILAGQGMGALLCTAYIKKYDNFLDGLILSGMPSDNGNTGAKLRCKIEIAFRGEYHRSASLYNSIIGANEKNFSDEDSPAAWLVSDRKIMEQYEKDPRCGFKYTLNGYQTFFDIMDEAYVNGSWILKNHTLPIRIVAGENDVTAGSEHRLLKIADFFSAHNYDDIETNIIKNLRHDIYNDIGHERTQEYFLNVFKDVAGIIAAKEALQ